MDAALELFSDFFKSGQQIAVIWTSEHLDLFLRLKKMHMIWPLFALFDAL